MEEIKRVPCITPAHGRPDELAFLVDSPGLLATPSAPWRAHADERQTENSADDNHGLIWERRLTLSN